MKFRARILRGAFVALCLLASTVFLPGCALLQDEIEVAAKAGGKLVKKYCENVTIPEFRLQIRERVNYHAAPHSIRVDCAIPSAPPLISSPSPEPPTSLLVIPRDEPDTAIFLGTDPLPDQRPPFASTSAL